MDKARTPECFTIDKHRVGVGQPCFIIAEVAQAHDGSLGTAHAYIDAVARSGAHAIKFQTHVAAAESTPQDVWRVPFSRQDASRYDYWKRMEFTAPQWQGLADHAADAGLVFLSSPFSHEAVALLASIGMPAWKVASGELTNVPLLHAMARHGQPLLFSSGMATWHELDQAVAIAAEHGVPWSVWQCTTAYPCPPEQTGLNVLAELRERYGCAVGFSDHSAAPYAGLAAATLGASFIEVHVTLSRDGFGPDTCASLTMEQLHQLVAGVHFIQTALRHPVVKEDVASQLAPLKTLFGRSVVAAVDLPPGRVLQAGDLACKKPGGGIPAAAAPGLVGRRLHRALRQDEMLEAHHLGEADA